MKRPHGVAPLALLLATLLGTGCVGWSLSPDLPNPKALRRRSTRPLASEVTVKSYVPVAVDEKALREAVLASGLVQEGAKTRAELHVAVVGLFDSESKTLLAASTLLHYLTLAIIPRFEDYNYEVTVTLQQGERELRSASATARFRSLSGVGMVLWPPAWWNAFSDSQLVDARTEAAAGALRRALWRLQRKFIDNYNFNFAWIRLILYLFKNKKY